MADITVTSSSNMDAAQNLALLDGDNITINNGVTLTVDSDVLYSQQAARPRSVSVVNTGKLLIDASNVWLVPFDAATGNVPSLPSYGTLDVSIGGASVGEFLGVWSSIGTLAPLSAGVAIPSAGFVKLRRKTGTIADNDVLTFSNGATVTVNSATGGRRGWLWFALTNISEAAGISGNVEFVGDWFDVGTSDGTTTQTMQFYAPWRVPGLQIETAAGSNVFEWWCNSINLTANLDLANPSNRTFSCNTAGVISFANRAPPNGARVRCPNLLNGYDMAGTNKARGNFVSQGLIKMRKVISCHTIYPNVYPGLSADFAESAFSGTITTTTGLYNAHKTLIVDDCAVSCIISDGQAPYFFTGSAEKVSINKLYAANGCTVGVSISSCNDVTITNSYLHHGASSYALGISYCKNITVDTCDLISTGNNTTPLVLTSCSRGTFKNIGVEPSGAPGFAIGGSNVSISACDNLVLDNFRHPANYNRACSYAWCNFASNNNVHFRNFGTASSPYLNFCGRSMLQGNGNTNCTVARVYTSEVGGGWYTIHGYQNKDISQNDYVPTTTGVPFFGNNTGPARRKYGASPVSTGKLFSKELPMFSEYQASNTSIVFNLVAREKDAATNSETNAYQVTGGSPTFDSLNSAIYFPAVGDEVTFTWAYAIRGLVSFANTSPVIGGVNTGNLAITYDLDRGLGFSGTFKQLTAANLSAETNINKSGTRIRIKVRAATANADNALYRIHFYGTTTAADIAAYPYPLSNPQITVTQTQASTLAALFDSTTGELLARMVGTGQVVLQPDFFESKACTLRVNKAGWAGITIPVALTEYFQTFPVAQTDTTIPDTDPGALSVTVTNHGASPVTWNGKQFSVTVTVADGSTASQVAAFISWNRSLDAFGLLGTIHNAALHDCIVPVGTSFETVRGTVFGSSGATLKGVRVVDGSGNAVPGFSRMQADDGSYFTPAASYTLTVANIVAGSRILVRRTDTSAIIANEINTSGTFLYTYTHTTDIPIEIVVRKASASPFYQEWRTTSTLSNSNNTQTANQLIDT